MVGSSKSPICSLYTYDKEINKIHYYTDQSDHMLPCSFQKNLNKKTKYVPQEKSNGTGS